VFIEYVDKSILILSSLLTGLSPIYISFKNTEYLSKAGNNRTLLRKIINDPDKIIPSVVHTKEDLFKFVEENTYDLFHYKGKYFKSVYNLLVNTSKRGKRLEDIAFELFTEVAKKKGINIVVTEPSMEEDIFGGIDGIFFYNDKKYTIQVKPLFKIEDYKKDPNNFIVFCDGVLKELKTDYLIVTNQTETKIFKSKGIITNSSYFIVPKSNITE
jgi:hypothetical protein